MEGVINMPVPFTNMEDIIYCHDEAMADKISDFLRNEGYSVGVSGSQIETGTHGTQVVKRIDVYKNNAVSYRDNNFENGEM